MFPSPRGAGWPGPTQDFGGVAVSGGGRPSVLIPPGLPTGRVRPSGYTTVKRDGSPGDGLGRSMAFPNAYVSTDEPPRPSRLRRALCLVAMVGLGYLGLVILALSLFWAKCSPVTQAASDYGVGAFAAEMNSGFFIAGLGLLSLSVAILPTTGRRVVKAGALLLVPAALALILNAFFQADIEGAARTLHGTVHGIDGAVFFFTSPAGLLLTSLKFERKWTWILAWGLAFALASLAVPGLLGLDAGGLGERILILVVFSSAAATAFSTMSEA